MLRPDKFSSSRALFRLIVFLSFTGGLITAAFFPSCSGLQLKYPYSLMLVSFPMALILIFSASVMGLLLIPLSSFFSGLVSYAFAFRLIATGLSGSAPETEKALIFITALPVFFLISVNGMQSSRILLTSLLNGSPALKSAYSREYIPMALCVIAAVIALGTVIA